MNLTEFDLEEYSKLLEKNSFNSNEINASVVPLTVAKQILGKAIHDFSFKAIDDLYTKTLKAIEDINLDFEETND